MNNSPDEDERRDMVLKRMLMTPKTASKVSKKGDEPKPAAPSQSKKPRPRKATTP